MSSGTPPAKISIIRPDDWHLHVRDGEGLKSVVPFTARQCGRAIIMPNLTPPVTTTERAKTYQKTILAAAKEYPHFRPLMTLYLTDSTPPEEIKTAVDSGIIFAVKLYPAGATTNSDAGVTDLRKCYPTLEMMQKLGLPLLVHGEVTHSDIDIFDREKKFIDQRLIALVRDFPELKVVFEHITTADAADFVIESSPFVAATITAHHLLMNRNDMLVGGIKPHHYCLPVLKRETHREALVKAAISGNQKFFMGTDSAPHAKNKKETSCGCAGMFTAFAAIELYTEAFEQAGALDRLEAFSSLNGPLFYGLEANSDKITLQREKWTVSDSYQFGDDVVIPLRAGHTINWKILC
ncbi:MAG: dihydroorotase [gamma proteobacterium symbiont of Bathyaustriella thionipta]|nr:dihydroorotase [gamma proteobacterium symbiont of Bathyaustriella thionipta]MCU7948657.1 dihydroorotase [gamma proteobacterium symbiont of Bathyaustriella thionipta]MCU7953705.1 dihydroorotase [gamma proteobacterium symbiont of Bathyaustriella thionipta]MCU7955188.1 dihydroorotase [gamma proteobacterium symbiont of Bathyaustriella thionipta]